MANQKTITSNLRVPEVTWKRLKKQAEKKMLSANSWVLQAILEKLSRERDES